jgi:3-phosphoshikimate 1-carboxyvinyltransferase
MHLHSGAATVKSTLLLAALNCPGVTSIVEPGPTDLSTEILLGAFGARVVTNDLPGGIRVTEIAGLPDLRGRSVAIPADPGQALYPLLAALVVPGSSLLLQDIHASPSRMGLILALIEMGADITLINRRVADGIEFADIRVRHSTLRGIDLPSERVPTTIRDYHLLTLAAAFATGTTTMPGLAPAEDWDRLSELAEALNGAGASAERAHDRMVVHGSGRLRGAVALKSHRDPALTLCYLIMGMAARDPVTIDDDSAAAIAYPGFVEQFERLGVRFSRILS